MPDLLLASPTVRQLPPEEFPRLASFEPFASHGLPDPTHWRVIVAEVDSAIVGFVCLFEAVHLEPLWVAPDYRARPRLFHQLLTDLWREGQSVLQEAGVQMVFAVVSNDHQPRGGAFLQHLGFVPSQGQLFLVPVSNVRLGGE